MKKMFKHPEQLEDEIYITNVSNGKFINIGWKTKRVGLIGINVVGDEFNPDIQYDGLSPVFIKRQELINESWTLNGINSSYNIIGWNSPNS